MSADLADCAILAARAERECLERKDLEDQRTYVRNLVGADLFGQCSYDATNNWWTIGGEHFTCFTLAGTARNSFSAPSSVPCLGWWNGTSYFPIYTFAQLGTYLEHARDRRKNEIAFEEKVKANPSLRGFWGRLLRDGAT